MQRNRDGTKKPKLIIEKPKKQGFWSKYGKSIFAAVKTGAATGAAIGAGCGIAIGVGGAIPTAGIGVLAIPAAVVILSGIGAILGAATGFCTELLASIVARQSEKSENNIKEDEKNFSVHNDNAMDSENSKTQSRTQTQTINRSPPIPIKQNIKEDGKNFSHNDSAMESEKSKTQSSTQTININRSPPIPIKQDTQDIKWQNSYQSSYIASEHKEKSFANESVGPETSSHRGDFTTSQIRQSLSRSEEAFRSDANDSLSEKQENSKKQSVDKKEKQPLLSSSCKADNACEESPKEAPSRWYHSSNKSKRWSLSGDSKQPSPLSSSRKADTADEESPSDKNTKKSK